MGCALVRVRPQQLVADHADRPEMARQRRMTSGKPRTAPAVSGGPQDKSAVNGGVVADSKDSAAVKSEAHLATCSSHNQAPAAQVRNAKR